MFTLRWVGKVLLPVGLLTGVLLVPGDAGAATKTPVVPTLEKALTLLESSQGKHLPEAVLNVRAALGDLGHQSAFTPMTPVFGFHNHHHFFLNPKAPLAPLVRLSALEKDILEPPGGLFVLFNRRKVELALNDLKAAQGQLRANINALKLPPNSAQAEALRHVTDAIIEVQAFLNIPFIF
jgi:hypothetical protein